MYESDNCPQVPPGRDESRRLLRPNAAAEYIGCSPATLAKWRCVKSTGPTFRKLGRLVVYELAALNAWIEAHAPQRNTTRVDTTA